MIKEERKTVEVTERHRYCDDCGVKLTHTMACSNANCEECGKDLCDKCVGYEEPVSGDYRKVWCKRCWALGEKYKPLIAELESQIDSLYEEWEKECKSKL